VQVADSCGLQVLERSNTQQAVLYHPSQQSGGRANMAVEGYGLLYKQAALQRDQPALYRARLLVTGVAAWTTALYPLQSAAKRGGEQGQRQLQPTVDDSSTVGAASMKTLASTSSSSSTMLLPDQVVVVSPQQQHSGNSSDDDASSSSHHQPSTASNVQDSSSSSSSGGSSSSNRSSNRGIFDALEEISPQQLEEAGYAQVQQLLAPLVGKSPWEIVESLPQVLPRLAPVLADGTVGFLFLPAPMGLQKYKQVSTLQCGASHATILLLGGSSKLVHAEAGAVMIASMCQIDIHRKAWW
jgi:hypothetical protein